MCAAASRICADQGVFDAFGHLSMRHPDSPERFLMARLTRIRGIASIKSSFALYASHITSAVNSAPLG